MNPVKIFRYLIYIIVKQKNDKLWQIFLVSMDMVTLSGLN